MLVALILSSVGRGSGKEPSPIGVTKCSAGDISILVLLIVIGICMSTIGAVLVQRVNKIKKRVGYIFTEGDLDMNAKTCIKIATVALLGGFFNAGFGISSTFILNPYLIQIGVPPLIVGSTGIFAALINNISSTVSQILYKKLNLVYALIICVPTILGAVLGIYCQRWLIAKTGRGSSSVAFLMFFLVFSVILNPAVTIYVLVEKSKKGYDLITMPSYCPDH